jgi:hypothetical protein
MVSHPAILKMCIEMEIVAGLFNFSSQLCKQRRWRLRVRLSQAFVVLVCSAVVK